MLQDEKSDVTVTRVKSETAAFLVVAALHSSATANHIVTEGHHGNCMQKASEPLTVGLGESVEYRQQDR